MITNKKIATVILSSLMLFTCTVPYFANAEENVNVDSANIDPYVNNLSQNVNVDGKNYNLNFVYDENNNDNITYIEDTKSEKMDVLIQDKDNGVFYLNGEKVAEIKTDFETPKALLGSSSYWKYINNSSTYISWKKGIAAVVLAGIIAGAMGGGATAAAILGSCGSNVMSLLAGGFIGGRLYWTKWYHVNVFNYHYKIDWAIKDPKGKRYGTYYVQYTME
ncbi:hypothetical protein [Peptostreptococcus stomatis]|uniref:hypothetical protein n=1 Tax=Peptostreptococcus stomatis TaxID=341694 RepID=UPI0028D13B71|nr:hypothetical protein [Peptostreptococcus stomatis]